MVARGKLRNRGLDVGRNSWPDLDADLSLPTTVSWLAVSKKNLTPGNMKKCLLSGRFFGCLIFLPFLQLLWSRYS